MTEQRKPTVEDMLEQIERILATMSHMPDKASIDEKQLQKFYSSLTVADMEFKDLEQIAILKKEID